MRPSLATPVTPNIIWKSLIFSRIAPKTTRLSRVVKTCPMVRGTGFEPVGPALQLQPVTQLRVPGGAPVLQDPDLAVVVKAWPSLSADLKAVILDITQSTETIE